MVKNIPVPISNAGNHHDPLKLLSSKTKKLLNCSIIYSENFSTKSV